MSRSRIIEKLEQNQLKTDIEDFDVGDTISVNFRVIEGDKSRIQVFTGTVIARKGTGLSETFSLHRVAYGEGMERVFPLHSPRIDSIVVLKRGKVRQSKLYYLRGTSGKKAKVKGRIDQRKKVKLNSEAIPVQEEKQTVVEETIVNDIPTATATTETENTASATPKAETTEA